MKRFGVLFAVLALATQQICGAPPTNAAPPAEMSGGMCPKAEPLGNAVMHCMKLGRGQKQDNKNSSMVMDMDASNSKLMATCPHLCIMKTMNMLDADLMPIKSNMKNMLMALSNGIKNPKTGEMMSKLLDSCFGQYAKTMGTNIMHSDEHSSKEASDEQASLDSMHHMSGPDAKCLGIKELMTCMNKGLPCPAFGSLSAEEI